MSGPLLPRGTLRVRLHGGVVVAYLPCPVCAAPLRLPLPPPEQGGPDGPAVLTPHRPGCPQL